MRISTLAATALLAIASAVSAAPAPRAPAPQRFTPVAALQPARIVGLVRECRRLSVVAYRTGDTRALDAYLARLFRDQARNRDEILACAGYAIGGADSGFYLPDPR